MEPDTDNLTVIEVRREGMLDQTVFASDPQGNIWQTTNKGGQGAGRWKLVRTHEEVVWPTLSVQQVLDAAKERE